MARSDPPDLLPGTLDLLILRIVARGPMHGYGIAHRLKTLSDEVLQVGESSLYPALQRLLLSGDVDAEWGREQPPRPLLHLDAGRPKAPRCRACGVHRNGDRNSTGARDRLVMTSLFRRLRARFRYRRFEKDLWSELEEHRLMAEDELRARGATGDDVRRLAARRLGNVTLAREDARAVWIAPWLENVWRDVQYGLRGLRRHPAFTLPALAVLVITMGLTTGLFVAAESILLWSWPVDDRSRSVHLAGATHRRETLPE